MEFTPNEISFMKHLRIAQEQLAQLDAARGNTPAERFENAIRDFGVVAACEWFGYPSDSEFTKDTTQVLQERLAAMKEQS